MEVIDPKPFKFKQFEVHHHVSTFKVNTDGVLLGAWANIEEATAILDIGTGSGVIALMAAQRNPRAQVSAIEIDTTSAAQAKYNADLSPFASRITVVLGDFLTYGFESKFDAIVCNPPYFVNSTKSTESSLKVAKHRGSEFLEHFLSSIKTCSSDGCLLSLILPIAQLDELLALALCKGFHPSRITRVSSYTVTAPFTVLVELKQQPTACLNGTLALYSKDRIFSEEHRALTKEFYLAK